MGFIRPFVRLIGISRLAVFGAALVTAGFVGDVLLILGEMFIFLSNPYIGIISYMVFPGIMALGLGLIPLGIWLRLRRRGRPITMARLQRLSQAGVVERPARVIQLVFLLTAINLVTFAVIGYRGFHYMDSTEFCGEVCHEVMIPEFTAYQRSPHAEVECVECHIGPGAGWFVRSKISGARQVLAVTFDTYHRPIDTPIENLRPARQVCEVCHRPEHFHGDLIRQIQHFKPDAQNTPTYTVLNMRVGGIGRSPGSTEQATGIHWHVAEQNTLRYYATDEDRENIVYIEQQTEDGGRRIWTRPDEPVDPATLDNQQMRRMDCVDCHNRPTHIFDPPIEAIEKRMRSGELDRQLPWIRKVGEQVLLADYASHEAADRQIRQKTLAIYQEQYPQVFAEQRQRIDQAIGVLSEIYRANVFPKMRIRWNTYTSLIGHGDAVSGRCFRCHDGAMRDQAGEPITIECESCHYVLARDSEDPKVLNVLRGRPTFYRGQHD
jgi:hypothetical protein